MNIKKSKIWILLSFLIIILLCLTVLSFYLSNSSNKSSALGQLGKIISKEHYKGGGFDLGQINKLALVYISQKPFLYYNIIDGGSGSATVIHGLLDGNNKAYWIEFYGKYSGVKNGNDYIYNENQSESLGLKGNPDIYNFLLNRAAIQDNTVPLQME